MIQIDDPPKVTACATCAQPLTWLWSPRRRTWVGFVPAGEQHTIRPHPCRESGGWPTWRQTRRGSAPTAEYLAAKAALTEHTAEHRDITEEETDGR